MSNASDDDSGASAGCLIVIAATAVSIGIGCLYGAGYGFVWFGLFFLLVLL